MLSPFPCLVQRVLEKSREYCILPPNIYWALAGHSVCPSKGNTQLEKGMNHSWQNYRSRNSDRPGRWRWGAGGEGFLHMTPRIKLYVFPREAKQVPTKSALEQHHQEIIKNSASCTYAMTTEDSRMRKFIFQGEPPGPPATGTRSPESVTNPVWLLPLLFCGLVCSAWDLLPPGGVLASLWDGWPKSPSDNPSAENPRPPEQTTSQLATCPEVWPCFSSQLTWLTVICFCHMWKLTEVENAGSMIPRLCNHTDNHDWALFKTDDNVIS